MPLSRELNLLAQWVALKHRGQLIRRSGKPYLDHLLAVAEMAASFTTFGYEIGLCHDLLEKTVTTAADLKQNLISFGYNSDQAAYITSMVLELTDVYTKSAYPHLSKETRKEKEGQRLITLSAGAQTVKYADLADNIQWVLKYDTEQITSYLLRKKPLVASMSKGNAVLRQQVLDTVERLSNIN